MNVIYQLFVMLCVLLPPELVIGEDARNGPQIVDVDGRYRLILPDSVTQAIQRAAPGFRPWKIQDYPEWIRQQYKFTDEQCMFAVVGRFDDDLLYDVAIDGHDERTACIIAAVSGDSAYNAVVLARWPLPASEERRDAVLEIVQRGTALYDAEGDTLVVLERDGIGEVYEARGWTLHYVDQGCFARIEQGD